MRYLFAALLVGGLSGLAGRAADDSPTVKQSIDELKKAWEAAQKQHVLDLQNAGKAVSESNDPNKNAAAEKRLAALKSNPPGLQFAARFLEIAQRNPTAPEALSAIRLALQAAPRKSRDEAIAYLQAHWVQRPEIQRVLRDVAGPNDDRIGKLLRDVMARNTDRKAQALACKLLAQSFAKIDPKKSDELMRTLHKKYGDFYPDLSVGKKAPEIVGFALDGKEARLSALRGKVVVLDIWATWCPHCRAMIPQERAMVERFRDRPFALISISCDDKKKALTDFLKKQPLPWRQWWNGDLERFAEAWDIDVFPTVYVLGPQGVIRYKNVTGEDLDTAVETLLREMEGKR